MTADLSALIASLEAAEVGSRELDDAVWFAATGEKASYPFDDETDPHIRYGTLAWVRLPRSTTSLDAALALAERLGLDVWHIMYAAMMNWKAHDPRGPASRIMPLALCIAILRAKQGEGDDL